MQSNVLDAAPHSKVPSQSQVNIMMDVDYPPHERGTKRSVEDDPPESHKKAKFGIKIPFPSAAVLT